MKNILIIISIILLYNCSTHKNTSPDINESSLADPERKQLTISKNRRFLQFKDGTPFFYLGDTAWELFHKLSREEAYKYLSDRAQKGFTVIQAVALSELDGINKPNYYGKYPIINHDPARPDTIKGDNNDYWDHVDYIINKANTLNLYIGLLPTWGSHWHDNNKIFTKENAFHYGRFLGKRYKNAQIIWILGGDRNPETEEQKDIIRSMAKGIMEGDEGMHLITFHPTGWSGSSTFFHNEDWLDFNMRQNGHEDEYLSYSGTLKDYQITPIKPVIDGESLYEDHPISFNANQKGHSISADTRRALYWNLFNGAFGHTYGHHSVWQMYKHHDGKGVNMPLMPWNEALEQPGASQMVYGRRLIESRPFFSRIPATDKCIIESNVKTSVPGNGRYRYAATCDSDSSYMMVYFPIGREITINTQIIKSSKIKVWWYNPRNGKAKKLGILDNIGKIAFNTPTPGELLDWVLVIDDAHKKYPAPGFKQK